MTAFVVLRRGAPNSPRVPIASLAAREEATAVSLSGDRIVEARLHGH